MRHWILAPLLAIGLIAHSSAAISLTEGLEAFEEANALYDEGNYQGAINIYRELIDLFPMEEVLHFNLGNAHFQLEEPGMAVWAYEMALLVQPGWPEADHNLALTRPKAPAVGSLVTAPVRWARDSVPPRRWSWVAVGAWAATLLLASAGLMLRQGRLRRFVWQLTALGGVGIVIACCALGIQYAERRTSPPSIVVAPSSQMRSSPGAEVGISMGELPAGTRVWQVQESSPTGWVKIRTDSGQLGFVDQQTLRVVRL